MRWVLSVCLFLLASFAVQADALSQSKRPNARVILSSAASPVSLVRPQARPAEKLVPVVGDTGESFSDWMIGFRQRAQAVGIAKATLDASLRGVVPDPDVIRRDRNQAEFTKTIWDYLATAVSDTRIENGRAALSKYRTTLKKIEAEYDVDHQIVVAIWGLESAFGAFRGSDDTLRSLATLAHDGRRSAFFEAQLIAALRILQSGDVTPRDMRGSWRVPWGTRSLCRHRFWTMRWTLPGTENATFGAMIQRTRWHQRQHICVISAGPKGNLGVLRSKFRTGSITL